ncbi:MAG: AAA family ATPase, partial [Bdellovibrionaceae bacterium]|nr:AAA family ATPase [Pseudobdellovibrionaceae bacterium]
MLSREIERRISEAMEMAKKKRHEFVTTEHILLALVQGGASAEILRSLGADLPRLKKRLLQYIEQHTPTLSQDVIDSLGGWETWKPEFTLSCHRWIQRAMMQVKNAGKNLITEGHFLVSLFYEPDSFAVHALELEGLRQFDIIQFISHGDEGTQENQEFDDPQNAEATGSHHSNSTNKSKNTSALEQFATNLNERAKAGKIDPLIGRTQIIQRIFQILGRRFKNNPLLIGDPGVGKTAIVEGLALMITQGQVPELLKNRIIYAVDMGLLLAGTKFRGDFEARLKQMVNEARQRKEVILFIDEIHTLVGAGSTGGSSLDAANLLKPALANGEISCIGSTTFEEYRKHFEKDAALSRRFQKIDVNEPSIEETIEILKGLKPKFESYHGVTYSDQALEAAVHLSKKYIHGKFLPDKAIDLIDEAGSYHKIHGNNHSISSHDIEEVLKKITTVTMVTNSQSEREQLRTLQAKLQAFIFGQDEAIEALVNAIKFVKSGLRNEQKPIGSFLFTGPTGVGKTELARQLAIHLGLPLVRFDMSEYMEKHSVSRFIGAPPGYVGFEEGGQLTETIKQKPHVVLLLDEIEKAH